MRGFTKKLSLTLEEGAKKWYTVMVKICGGIPSDDTYKTAMILGVTQWSERLQK